MNYLLASQTANIKLLLCLSSLFGFYNLALLSEKPGFGKLFSFKKDFHFIKQSEDGSMNPLNTL